VFQSFEWVLGIACTMREQPNFIVVPLASEPGTVVAFGGWRTKSGKVESRTLSLSDAETFLAEALQKEDARDLVTSWGDVDETGQETTIFSRAGSVFVAVLTPKDIPPERRAECEGLVRALAQDRLAPIVVLQADTSWGWDKCSDPETIRTQFPLIANWDCLEGTMRETVVLPPRKHAKSMNDPDG
jgi:hypothetical protein